MYYNIVEDIVKNAGARRSVELPVKKLKLISEKFDEYSGIEDG